MKFEEEFRLEISISLYGTAISGSIQKKQLFCRMDTTSVVLRHKGAARGGAEGAQAPPLSNQNIDAYFLSFSPTL